jgi:hydroxyethylthiazole kinase-like uncharacterized protein yjeF
MPRHHSREHTPISPALLREWPIEPAGRGTALIVGGARTLPGAVLLTGTAALRAGAGTLQLATSNRHAVALGVAVPEAAVFGLSETGSGAIARDAAEHLADLVPKAQSIVIGPGLTDADETLALLERLLPRVSPGARVVLDAFALGALSRSPALTAPLADRVVLTPNVTEAAFLLDRTAADIDDDHTGAAAEIAKRYRAVVTLMGSIATPDGQIWLDGGGHIGLATSGSGDVLAGLVGGFLARPAEVGQAVCWATHVHAVAGQRLIPRTGATGLLARDLVTQVPVVIAELDQ